ncbi:hypothetical protein K3727_09460 [Rhodobacteraceae bacterium M382]|nr:hypothetical protein K3727_09460 [Rhodobacteraceae bacterium M382]
MFNIDQTPEFTRTVDCRVPSGDSFETQTFLATFRVIADDDQGIDWTSLEGVKDHLRARIVSFDDLCDAKGKPVAYSEATRETMLALPYVRGGLLRTYTLGITEARAGN